MEILLIAWCVWTVVILIVCPLINHDREFSRRRIRQTAPAAPDSIRISTAVSNDWEMLKP